MGFQGSLDTVGLTDIFQLFGFGRKSGALHLRHDAEHGVIHFDQGDVFYATMSPGEVVGNLLVRADLVSPDQWRQVLADSDGESLQGEVVTRLEGIDTVAIEVFLRERVEDTVFRLAQWDGGEFELVDEAHPFGPAFRFETEALLATAERRMDEWRRIREVVPSVDMGVQAVSDLPEDRAEIVVARDEWRLLARLTPGCDVAEVAAALGETEFRTCRTLAAMVDSGIVELIAREKLEALRSLSAADRGHPMPDLEPEPEQVLEPESVSAHAPAPEPEPGPLVSRTDWVAPADPVPKMSLADLAAAAEGSPSQAQPAAEVPPEAHLAAAAAPDEPDDHFAAGDLAGSDYPPLEHTPQSVVQPYLDAVTPPPVVYSSFEQSRPESTLPAPVPLPFAEAPATPPPGNGTTTGEVPLVARPGEYTAPAPMDFGHEAPATSADTALAEAAAGDSELDKSLILRLIAGVKSL